MKRSRYSEEQIIGILKEVEAGLKVTDSECLSYQASQESAKIKPGAKADSRPEITNTCDYLLWTTR